jgi:hypothetical protein
MEMQCWLWTVLTVVAFSLPAHAFQHPRPPAAYLGFDRNDYPGDANLPALRSSFAFTGYWLNNPPGESANSWHGKRATVERAGFGFLLLFNGRAYSELKSWRQRPPSLVPAAGAASVAAYPPPSHPSARTRQLTVSAANPGPADGAAAARAALQEGFPRGSVIFLDQEEGGRMLPEQKRYVFAWASAVRRAGFRPGVYCSGIPVAEPDGTVISTARDLYDSPQGRQLVFWVANDACPPSPGCGFPRNAPPPEASGAPFAEVWQFAQSPVRRQFAAACLASYNADGNCYPPQASAGRKLHLDVNSALLPDPSHGRPAPAAGGPSVARTRPAPAAGGYPPSPQR